MLAILSLALGQASTVNNPVYNVLTAYGQSCNDACDVFDLSCVSLPFNTSIPNTVGNLTALTLATNPPVNCTNLKFSESYGIGMPRVELNGNCSYGICSAAILSHSCTEYSPLLQVFFTTSV
ncbi:hypothetical protein EMVG_00075 [Emiliania huxleyi virus PS401]|nr:hypothetical protein EMVG_00075 [Emiliania huxleyi virus PS401]